MRSFPSPPGRWLIIAVLYALATGVVVILLAVERPWLGMRFSHDGGRDAAVAVATEGPAASIPAGTAFTRVSGGEDSMLLSAEDFIREPDGVIPTYADYETFLRRQGRLAAILEAPVVTFTDVEGREWQVKPASARPLGSLPPEFWVQMTVGVVAWLISAGVWVFRRQEASAGYLLLSGWSTLLFAPLPAVYMTRELGLPTELFRWLSDLNFMGGSLFAGTMVALLTCYPRRVGPRWLGLAAVGAQAAWFVAQQAGVFDSMILARRILVMVALAGTFALAGIQWFHTRRDPVGRASLRWFLLSWVVGSGVFGLLILMPQMFGIDTTAFQGYGFLLFLLVYAGLAFGILRFRLFGLDEWWARIVTWLVALLVLVVLDLLFLLKLHFSSGTSLGMALFVCGVLWLPLRGFLWDRFVPGEKDAPGRRFKDIVDVVLAPQEAERAVRWKRCLVDRFDALYLEDVPPGTGEPKLADDGLALLLPAVGDLGALRLQYARRGTRLFSSRDLLHAREAVDLLRHVFASRNAYEEGVKAERSRMARDIHDHVGSRLLSALHSREEGRRDELLRETMADLRDIINDASDQDVPAGGILADLRHESAERLALRGIALDWQADFHAGKEGLPRESLRVLRPLIREAVTNIIKHSGATTAWVSIGRIDGELVAVVEDDGPGAAPPSPGTGNGLANMKRRLEALRGCLETGRGKKNRGWRLVFRYPLAETLSVL